MALVLTRMKIFSPFVSGHFTLEPKYVSLTFFIVCFGINLPFVFASNIRSSGSYSYYDKYSSEQKVGTLYSVVPSEFSLTPFGQVLYGVITLFLNLFLTLVVGLALNIISVYQYKSYLREKKKRDEAYSRAVYSQNKQSNQIQQKSTFLIQDLTHCAKCLNQNLKYLQV